MFCKYLHKFKVNPSKIKKKELKTMDNISVETLHDFCRTCLKRLKRQKCDIHILDLRIRHWLQDATIDNPSANDTYPNSICHSCRNKLKDILEFRQMCAHSRQKLRDILESQESTEQIIHPSVQNTTTEEKEATEDIADIAEVEQHFITIEKNEPQAAKKSIKSEASIGELNIEEDLLSSSGLTYVKNEAENELYSYEYLKSDDDLRNQKDDSSDDEICQYGEGNSDSESHILNEDEDGSLLDGSWNIEDSKCRNKTKTKSMSNKNKTKTYTYSFRCDQCKYRCVSQQILDIHMRTHLGLKPHQCPRCDISFEKSAPMLKHLNDEHGEKELSIICEHVNCGQQFTSTASYKKHYRQNHINEQAPEKQVKPLIKTPQVHVCEECGKTFTKLQTFKEHQYTHGPKDLYPFQCTECDKAFVKQRTLKEHQMRHAGIKNFECSYCGAKKTTKKELRSHINCHTKEKKYPCPNCSMIFYRTSNMRIHVQVVHQGIRRFVCRYCDQTFGKGDNLKNHELIHTGEKPHECTECGKRFVQKVSLRSHMKTHNKPKK